MLYAISPSQSIGKPSSPLPYDVARVLVNTMGMRARGALFRARRQGSLNGVLDAAEAFGTLGDRVMVEQCIRIAERLTLLTGDADAAERVRVLAAGLAQRYIEVDRPEVAMAGGRR